MSKNNIQNKIEEEKYMQAR